MQDLTELNDSICKINKIINNYIANKYKTCKLYLCMGAIYECQILSWKNIKRKQNKC